MPIAKGFRLSLTGEDLAEVLRGPGHRSALREAATQAVDLIEQLAEPAAAYRVFPVRGVEGACALIGPDVRLHLGPHADLLAPAHRALVYAVTLGPRVEARVAHLFAEGSALGGYVLDSAAVIALGRVSDRVKRTVEQMAADLGWGVGPRLSPGSLVGWPLREQSRVLSLVEAEQIGVSISRSHILKPHKSATGLVGMGPGYRDSTVGSVCYLCKLWHSCWRYHG